MDCLANFIQADFCRSQGDAESLLAKRFINPMLLPLVREQARSYEKRVTSAKS